MTAIVVTIWWFALLVALVITTVAAVRLLAVVRITGEIRILARHTAVAVGGIAHHTTAIAGLAAVGELAPALLREADEVGKAAQEIAECLSSAAYQEER